MRLINIPSDQFAITWNSGTLFTRHPWLNLAFTLYDLAIIHYFVSSLNPTTPVAWVMRKSSMNMPPWNNKTSSTRLIPWDKWSGCYVPWPSSSHRKPSWCPVWISWGSEDTWTCVGNRVSMASKIFYREHRPESARPKSHRPVCWHRCRHTHQLGQSYGRRVHVDWGRPYGRRRPRQCDTVRNESGRAWHPSWSHLESSLSATVYSLGLVLELEGDLCMWTKTMSSS